MDDKVPPPPDESRRSRARGLRRQGLSIKRIAKIVHASQSSVSVWVRDVPLTPAQQTALRQADPARNARETGQRAWSLQRRAERGRAQQHGRALALAANPQHQAGCMLFWAEGSKQANSVIFTNSDADMVEYFVRFLRECYGVHDDDIVFRIQCHTGNGLTVAEIERWWLERLGLPVSSLRRTIVNRTSRASNRKGRTLLRGTARVVVYSTFIVQSIYGALQEYAGIERPEWLAPEPRPARRDAVAV